MSAAIDTTSKDVKIEKAEPEKVLVSLTDVEVLQRSRRAAQLEQQVEKKKKDLADAQKLEKSEIAKLESVRKQISSEIAVGQRYVEVDCLEVYNFRLGKVTLIRADTKEEIRERAMTVLERQEKLPLGEPTDLEDPDDEADPESPIVENDYATDTAENPDTSILHKIGDVTTPPESDLNSDEPQPVLPTQKKNRAPKGEGKGGKGSRGRKGGAK